MEGCLVCGSPIVYFENAKESECSICRKKYQSNALCVEGHFVCNECHREKGFEDIKSIALSSTSINPVEIADEMMKMESVNMHGPEHHFLVAAALLSAYFNRIKYKDTDDKIQCNFNDSDDTKSVIILKAEQRASNVPGGICGLWGSCGAAIGAGIFFSIITDSNPLTIESWSNANLLVSNALLTISENGGPRCCKRNTYLAITSATEFIESKMGVYLEIPENIKCEYFERNNECKHEECKYFR